MLSKLLVLVLLLLLGAPSTAKAQDYVRYRLPAGQRVHLDTGDLQGFSLEEYKILLSMDKDLKKADVVIPELEHQVLDMFGANKRLEYIVQLDEADLYEAKNLLAEKNVLMDDLLVKDAKLEKELAVRKKLFRITLGTGIAVIAGLVLGVFVAGQ